MQIITIDLIIKSIQTAYHTFGLFKDAIIMAVFNNLKYGFTGILHGEIEMIFIFIGSFILLWRLRSWLIGFFRELIIH